MMSSTQFRRFRRLRIAIAIFLVVLVAIVGLLQLSPVATWVARRLITLVPLNDGYRLRLARVSGSWFGGLSAEDLVLIHGERELARIPRLRARYSLGELLSSPLRIREIEVDGITASAHRQGDTWDLAKALRQSSDTSKGSIPIRIDLIDVRDASLMAALAPDSLLRVRGFTAVVRDFATGSPLTARIDRVNFAVSPPGGPWFAVASRGEVMPDFYRLDPIRIQTERTTIAGQLTLPRSLDDPRLLEHLKGRLLGTPVAMADLSTVFPTLVSQGVLDVDASVGAEGNAITGELEAGIGAGRLILSGRSPLESGKPQGVTVHATLRNLDPSKVVRTAPPGRIEGSLDAALRGALDTTSGTADLRLRSSRIGSTDLTTLRLHSDVERGRATIRGRGVTDMAAVTANGWVTPFDSVPAYHVYGSATDIPGTAGAVGTLAGSPADSILDVSFNISGSGFSVSSADLTGRLGFDAVRPSGERLALGQATVSLQDGRLVAQPDLAIGGGRVTAVATVHLGDTLVYRVTRGTISGVDPGRLMGDTLVGRIDGAFSLSGAGSTPATARASGRVTLDSITYGARRLDSASARLSLARGETTIDWRLAAGRGRITGTVVDRPFDSTSAIALRDGRMQAVDLGALLGDTAVRSDLNGTFTASRGGRGDTATTRIEMQLGPSTVNDAALHSGTVEMTLADGELEGRIGLDGRDGAIDVGVHGTRATARTSLRTRGTLALENLDKWTGRGDLAGRIEGRFDLEAETDSTGLRTIGGTIGLIGGVGDLRLQNASVKLAPVEGAIGVDTVVVRSNIGRLDGRGTIAIDRRSSPGLLRVMGELGDLAPLAAYTGDTLSADSSRVVLELGGPAYHWRGGVRLDSHGLLLANNLVEHMTLDVTAVSDSMRFAGASGELRVADAAFGTISVPSVTVVARYDSVVALDATAQVGDSIRLATTLRGTAAGDTVRATLQRLDLAEGGRRWTLDRPARLELGPRVRVNALSLSTGDRHITLDGVVDRHGANDIRLGINGLDLAGLRSAGLVPIGGRLDAALHLTGTAETPTLAGTVGLAILDSETRLSGRVRSDLEWKRSGLFVKAEAVPAAGGRMEIAGMLPYRFTLAPADTATAVGIERGSVDTLSVRVTADSFHLALFQPLLPPDAATDLTGILIADAHIGGRLDAPQARGALTMEDAALTLPALGVTYRDAELEGRLDGEDLRIARLRLTTGKDEVLTADGVVHLRPLTDPGLDLTAQLQDFRISNSPTLQSIASGKLRLTGSVNEPTVTGGLNLGRTDIYVGAEAASGKVEPVELSEEDLRKLARDFGPAVLQKTKEGPGLLSRAEMDIELRLPRRVWIRRRKSPEADIELAGQIRLRQERGGEMQFLGKVGPVPGRGTLDLSGRTFRLSHGEIDLNGPVDSAQVDVTAEYQVPTQGGGQDEGVVISVNATGRLDSLGLEFSSDPSMSQEDVLSYIVTGHPASDNALLEGGGQGTSGKQVAFGQLSQAIAGSAGRGLGFDVFQIKQEGTQGLNLTAGRYLSDRFFLNLKLPLGSGTTVEPGQNLGPGFELEYSAQRWLRAVIRGGSLPPAFLLRGRYAY